MAWHIVSQNSPVAELMAKLSCLYLKGPTGVGKVLIDRVSSCNLSWGYFSLRSSFKNSFIPLSAVRMLSTVGMKCLSQRIVLLAQLMSTHILRPSLHLGASTTGSAWVLLFFQRCTVLGAMPTLLLVAFSGQRGCGGGAVLLVTHCHPHAGTCVGHGGTV